MNSSEIGVPGRAVVAAQNVDEIAVVNARLLAYCRANNWAGHDPYDALNSPVFRLPFVNSRVGRLALTQALKRSPISIRRVLGIPKTQNPKAMALFLMACVKLSASGASDTGELVAGMVDRLIALRAQGSLYWSWGYSFPWQTRTEIVPRWAPNLVCTSFVGNALLDAYAYGRDPRCLSMAVSAAEYMVNELYWRNGLDGCGFAYPVAAARVPIHNANLLGAAFLCRVFRSTGETRFLDPAIQVARYSIAQQRGDGSWTYGEAPTQQWIDNFHTGYNVCALRQIGRYADTSEFALPLRRGFEFYRENLVRADGVAKYFHDRTYPIDIHCVAQSIITLVTFKDLDPSSIELAHKVFEWAMRHMWDERGFFWYRALRLCTIRTSYMRWSQAWMLLATSTLLTNGDERTCSRVSEGGVEGYAHSA